MLAILPFIHCVVIVVTTWQQTRPSGPRIAYDVLAPVSDMDVKAFAALTHMSAEQQAFMASTWEAYFAARQEVLAESLSAIDLLSLEAAKAETTQGFTATTVQAFDAFWSGYLNLQRVLLNQENVFFREVEGVLSAEQAQQMYRMRWRRERARCGRIERDVLASRIDLCQLVETAGGQDATQAADAVLIQYESTVTPVLLDLEQTINEEKVPLMRIANEIMFLPDGTANTFDSPEGKARADTGLRERRQLKLKAARLQTRVAAINEQFIDLLQGTLPQQVFDNVRDSYRAAAYPRVWPDRQSVMLVLSQALEEVKGEQREQLAAIADSYGQRHRSISESMQRVSGEWMEASAADDSMDGYAAYAKTMRQLRESRLILNQRTLADIKAAVGEQSQPELLKAIDARTEDLKVAALMQKSDEYPGP